MRLKANQATDAVASGAAASAASAASAAPPEAVHGGPDAAGVAAHDLSSNANACGPCPSAVAALAAADACHYPDPAYTALTAQLAHWHGVARERIVIGASASELIQRLSVAVALGERGAAAGAAAVWLPAHAYGDYARAACAAGLRPTPDAAAAALLWACEPSSPLGQAQAGLAAQVAALGARQSLVLDEAYAPLRLHGAPSLAAAALGSVWRLITPNKALGLTGVRAAYAIAPRTPAPGLLARVRALAPSWPLGGQGVALLSAWADEPAQRWLADARVRLGPWKARQSALLAAAGWRVAPSDANFFVATDDHLASAEGSFDGQMQLLAALRGRGVKLRDCASFGLPGHVRMAVVPPAAQDALMAALAACGAAGAARRAADASGAARP